MDDRKPGVTFSDPPVDVNDLSVECQMEALRRENEQLRKDLLSMQTGVATCRNSLQQAIANLTKYMEYKIPLRRDMGETND